MLHLNSGLQVTSELQSRPFASAFDRHPRVMRYTAQYTGYNRAIL